MHKMKYLFLAVMILALGLGTACDNGETERANKLIDEGNALIAKSGEIAPKASALMDELVGENLTKVEDISKHKADNKAKFDDLAKMYAEIEKNSNDAAAKFEEASKLKVDPKFQEYAAVIAQVQRKRVEANKVRSAFIKTFLAETEIAKIDAAIGDFNKKIADVTKEVDDLSAKADKITKDNPSVFKSDAK